jgi:hypothetical protein
MDIDFSSLGLGSTINSGISNGTPVSVGNVSPTFDSIEKVFAPEINREISISTNPAIDGWLTGRRPAFGQMYPRGLYNQ